MLTSVNLRKIFTEAVDQYQTDNILIKILTFGNKKTLFWKTIRPLPGLYKKEKVSKNIAEKSCPLKQLPILVFP